MIMFSIKEVCSIYCCEMCNGYNIKHFKYLILRNPVIQSFKLQKESYK